MNIQKSIFLASAIVFLSIPSFSEVKDRMDQMLGYILEIKPYVVSKSDYVDPKNATTINETLKKMITLSDQLKHEKMVQKTALQIPASELKQQLTETQLALSHGNSSYSYWLLRSTLSNCMSCHTQVPAESTLFTTSKNAHTSSFEEAEFAFIIRNFDQAIELYTKTLSQYPENKIPTQNLESAISRKVYYFTRVKRDLPGLSLSLKQDLKNTKLPEPTLKLIQDYSRAAELVAKDVVPKLNSEAELKKYSQNTLKSELSGKINYEDTAHNLRNLRLSGYLYEFMNQHPDTTLKPDIYYWLSFCESRWASGVQDSLPESYLRKCVKGFPKSKVAPLCYQEYKDLITMGYTGSAGTHIPPEVTAELNKMKAMIGPPKK